MRDESTNTNPVAIVTAAGRGMGAAIARELHAHNYRLALMSNGGGAVALAEEVGGVGMTGSVTEASDLEALVSRCLESYGRIDAVVNNTGHPPKGPLLEISDEDWHRGLDLVTLNVVRMARLVTPIMLEQGGGAMVNISTFAAFEPDPAFPVSSSLRASLASFTKLYADRLSSSLRASLASFTKLYADRYAADGIRMNNLLPGFVDSYPESHESLDRIPMGRYARVAEIARVARFLISANASYITGQNIRVDGGITRSV
jgi:NAD(P)-dependent dehydrogenase (short-subunit alcohol dehydrogenase family)